MLVFRDIKSLKSFLNSLSPSRPAVGLVPTMGALHDGHAALLKQSVAENEVTVCSLFINPTQFDNPRDWHTYPRQEEKDLTFLRDLQVTAAFIPTEPDMYPESPAITFDFGSLDKCLEGKFRPGHFSGVALIVSKLFNLVQPQAAYFGQKDYQQYCIIAQLIQQLFFSVRLVCVPTVRDSDGLALSSRNMRLSSDQRKRAVILYRALNKAVDYAKKGLNMETIRMRIQALCVDPSLKLEYIELAHLRTFDLLEAYSSEVPCIMLIAGWVGEVRLIDNVLMDKDV